MDDIFEKTPASGDQPAEAAQPSGETRVMAPLETFEFRPAHRRRRTEQHQDSYEAAAGEAPEAAASAEETPAETIQAPVSGQHAPQTTAVPRFQTRYNPPVPGSIPSQGVPRPAALREQTARRPVFTAGTEEVRRPVQAEGYTPVKPLGASRTGMRENADSTYARPAAPIPPRQIPTLDDDDEYEEEPGHGKGLVIAIIALLVVAALVLGMLLIPQNMEGPLGDAKRAVTGLFGGGQEENLPVTAMGFTGAVNRDTVPYQITFNVTTSTNVKDVRIVDESGLVMATTVTATIPNTDNTLHVLTMTLAEEYQGIVYLQINDGESWLDTDRQQLLTIGTDMKLKISDVPAATLTAVSTASGTADATLTAGSVSEPTVSPAMEENPGAEKATDEPTDEPDAQATENTASLALPTEPLTESTATPTAEPTTEPTEIPTATPEVTPTPTMAVTPTPTVNVTATPTAEPTATPTATPTAEPTAVPTATPVPTPAPTVKLEAAAGEGASPSLIYTQRIYKGTRRVESYQRAEEDVINMPAGDDYLTVPFGVTTFRGNAFRTNAAVGIVTPPSSMSVLWQVEGGKLEIRSGMRYGFGVYSQPAIVKWPKDVRQLMALNEGFQDKSALKEVILSGEDGKVYFLDLESGEATREAINIGYALRGAPSVHPLSYPILTFGQFSNKLPSGNAKTMGLYYYNLIDNSKLRLLNMLDDRAYYTVGAVDTSALIDRNSNTLITVGTNGVLYTEKLDFYFAENDGGVFKFSDVKEQAALMSHTKNQKNSYAAVESSLAMYGSYAFYADMDGILRCVDTTTMTTVWAVDTGDAVRAAIALDLDTETNTLWLYTANTITNRSKNVDVTIRRFNAMTGEEDWALPVHSIRKYSGQKDVYGREITAGAVASPIIGQNSLDGLVYFTLSSVSSDGGETLTGKAEKQPSMLIALNKADGKVAWTLAMDAYSYSSPVAVYSADGEGWVIQCCSNGTIYLLNGLTGEIVNTLQVAGVIEGSPAVYGDTMVFGTTGKDKSFVYAIKLQ